MEKAANSNNHLPDAGDSLNREKESPSPSGLQSEAVQLAYGDASAGRNFIEKLNPGGSAEALLAQQSEGAITAYKECSKIVGFLIGGDKESARQELARLAENTNTTEGIQNLIEVCKLIKEVAPSYGKDLHVRYKQTFNEFDEAPPSGQELKVTHVKVYLGGDANDKKNILLDKRIDPHAIG